MKRITSWARNTNWTALTHNHGPLFLCSDAQMSTSSGKNSHKNKPMMSWTAEGKRWKLFLRYTPRDRISKLRGNFRFRVEKRSARQFFFPAPWIEGGSWFLSCFQFPTFNKTKWHWSASCTDPGKTTFSFILSHSLTFTTIKWGGVEILHMMFS